MRTRYGDEYKVMGLAPYGRPLGQLAMLSIAVLGNAFFAITRESLIKAISYSGKSFTVNCGREEKNDFW